MTKPPTQKPKHTDSIQTSLRIPRSLHAELQAAADRSAHSLNTEILIRLQSSQHLELMAELAEVKGMLRRLLDKT